MKLAIFDFNGTIFPRETMPFLLSVWYKKRYSRIRLFKIFTTLLPLYLQYKMGFNISLTKKEMETRAVQKISELFEDMAKQEVHKFFKDAAQEALPLFNDEILEEIKKTSAESYHTVLLSGAFYPFLEEVAKLIGIKTAIGTQIPFSNNKALPTNKEQIINGNKKLQALYDRLEDKDIEWDKCIAFADSNHDIPLLEKVGHPIAVDPDNKLKNHARQENWRIIKTKT